VCDVILDTFIVIFSETNTWSQPLQMNLDGPTPRAALGMCAIDNKLVVFGGRDTNGRTNDLHIFDTGQYTNIDLIMLPYRRQFVPMQILYREMSCI
jgi:hypothetical protein